MIDLRIDFDGIKPIYIQIAEAIEDDIIAGKLNEGFPAYSQLVLSRELGINPATAAKGINQLVGKGILEKQRGLSMVVADGAVKRLLSERRDTEIWTMVESLVDGAVKVGLSKENIIAKITELFKCKDGSGANE